MKMKRMKAGLIILSIAALGLAPTAALARDKGEKAEKPFHGKIEALDTTAKTLTVGETMIYTSAATKFTKDGKAITLADLKVGEEVHGTTHETFDRKTEALTVKVGPLKEKDQPSKGEEPK